MDNLIGRIHSFESFALVDGPGVRCSVFLHGCALRCKFCHNPDTWKMNTGSVRSAQSLIQDYERNKAFYARGGITVTGGEALMQIDFLLELFSLAKRKGIHTCLDTSAATYSETRREDFETLLSYTDLVLLDFKHSDREEHKKLTGMYNDAPLAFAKLLDEKKIPMVVRHVLVPEITDTPEQLTNLGKLMRQFKNVVGLEVLPFHQMGTAKYKNLGIPYPLEGVNALTKEDGKRAKDIILKAYRES